MTRCQTPRPSRRARTRPKPAACTRCTPQQALFHSQIDVVANWLAEMGRQANWMSGSDKLRIDLARNNRDEMSLGIPWEKLDATRKRELWKDHLDSATNAPKEANRLAVRKQRLVALFGSVHCYSANVHADTNNLGDLVDTLLKLDRLPDQTPLEGLKLLSQAWDEHRSKYKRSACLSTAWPNTALAAPALLWACRWC